MRVVLVSLTGGGLSGGHVKYMRRMVPRLLSHPGISSLEVFLPAPTRERLRHEAWPSHSWPVEDAWRGYPRLKRAVRETRPDVIFIPTASWVHFGATPVVTMVRNMEPLEAPFGGNPLREAARNLARRAMARRACRRAARVIAVSEHVRDFLVSRWHIAREKVPVIYHGVDAGDPRPVATAPTGLAARLPEEFVFSAGSIRPARGLLDLIEALPRLRAGSFPVITVIAGQVDPGMGHHQATLQARARQLGVADRLIWAGRLSDGDMQRCYDACSIFVMTSRAEACPNIALEAMSRGCACVSVDRPPMPEFFGDGALYYRAGDAAGLASVIDRALQDRPMLRTLRTVASGRARQFTWEATTRQTVAELQRAIS